MKKLILIPIFLLVYNGIFGQGDKARFFRAVDIISCEFAYQSIKDQKDSPFLSDYQASFPDCGQELAGAFYSELTTFLRDKDLTATLKLCNGINNFKNRYETEFATKDASDYEDVNSVLTKIFNQASIQSFKSRHRNTYNGLMSRIGNEILALYGQTNDVVMVDEEETREPSRPQPQPKPIVPQPRNTETIVDNTTDEFDANDFTPLPRRDRITDEDFRPIRTERPFIGKRELFWLFAMMIFGLFGFYFVKNAVPQRYDGPLIAEEETMSLLKTLKKEMSKLQEHNDSLEEEVTRLKFRIQQFQEKNIIYDPPNLSKKSIEAHKANDDEQPPVPPIPLEEEIQLPPPVKTLISTTFFMPLPSTNGTFQGSLAENEFRRAESVYRFEITNDEGTMAVFTVHDDIATMIRALDDPDRYLKPACRSNSIPHISATKILTDKKGLAIKDGNDWKVQRKAIIRYA